MKKMISGIYWSFFVLLTLLFGTFHPEARAAEKVQYGGTLTYFDLSPTVNPISWDIYNWVWKQPNDAGFYMEHLIMGDLQKGPRGTRQYDFHSRDWIPHDIQRGQLLQNWEVKKNPLQIILHLRKGIMWQDKPGVMKARELTSDDVVYSFNRIKNSPKAIPLWLDFIDTMETPDKYTLVINMKNWCADWDYRLGWGSYSSIQAPEQEKAPGGANKWENACGTGPYMITEYKDGHSQTYTKNPNYWDWELINGKKYKLPFTDKIVMQIMKDTATRIASFRTGKIDLMMSIDWKDAMDLKKSNPQLRWSRYLYLGNFTLALRLDQKPFNDIRVRRAMNLAVNKKEIINSFYGGNAELHTYPFPPNYKDVYTPVDKLPPSARELFTYNPEKAKKLLAEAGYPNGFAFKAQISNGSQNQMDLAAMVVAYLAKIGVTLELEPMDYPSWLARMTKKNHTEGIFFDNSFGAPFTGIRKDFLTGQTWNPSMMSDPVIDNGWTDAVENKTYTDKQGIEIMKKLAVYGLDQAPCIILPTPYVYAAWWPWVKNYYGELCVSSHQTAPVLARIWIDQELKKKMGY